MNTATTTASGANAYADTPIALGLFAFAIVIAWLLNHRKAKLRTLGLGLAALGCFRTCLWIMGTIGGATRPAFTAMDPFKPIIMMLFLGVFAVAGLLLLFAAFKHSRQTDDLNLPVKNEPHRYGKGARYFHWIIAVLFIILVPMGVYTSMIPSDAPYRDAYYAVHKSLGITVFLLAFGRVFWLLKNPAPKLDKDMKSWEKGLAHAAHIALYLFLFLFPISGYLMSTFSGKVSQFYIWDLPLLFEADFDAADFPSMMHKLILPYLFYLVIIAHIAGSLKHRYIDGKLDALKRMVT